ncbi:phosphate ABC transporter substrate-binding protein PstS [Streptomyces smaragdinus]|uniref:phosphate ABC transporter substrate-binding protein PstS n=1 Tax=Streptomyces smaragdinus TaxID=2585196 RepID=UPI002B2036C6|nr:phosphate ABC transporter substrate-binding protein PstS [Streptomyces smaragdinus]
MKLQRKNGFRALTLGALAVSGALVLSACGSDDNTDADKGSDSSSSAAAPSDVKCAGKGELLGAGSSAQKNAVDKWVQDFQAACSDVTVNYNPAGSGAGIEAWLGGQVAFAGSDSPLKPEELEASKKICSGGQGINIPMVGGPIAVVYNVDGVDKLSMDAKTMADVFSGKIKTWDDAAIKKLNPDAKLPSTKIQPVHRSDESGTTDNFTKYLNSVAPDAWAHEHEKKWPLEGGQAADGSSGIASQVQQTAGTISYVELSYATASNLKTVDVATGAATPVAATVENASKSISVAKKAGTGSDLALELDYASKEEGAYPITLVTYEIACDKGNKAESLDAVKSFLAFTASEKGQASLSEAGYAPMPQALIAEVRTTVDSLS